MNIALVIKHGILSACFCGTEIWIIDPAQEPESHHTIATHNLQPVYWSRELLRHDVCTLLCTAIDQFTLGALKGNHIDVMELPAYTVEEALEQWKSVAHP